MQFTISLSTTEVEYMAVTKGAKMKWFGFINYLLENLGIIQDYVDIYCDGQSAIHLAENQVTHVRTNHIKVKFYKICQMVEDGYIHLLKLELRQPY